MATDPSAAAQAIAMYLGQRAMVGLLPKPAPQPPRSAAEALYPNLANAAAAARKD